MINGESELEEGIEIEGETRFVEAMKMKEWKKPASKKPSLYDVESDLLESNGFENFVEIKDPETIFKNAFALEERKEQIMNRSLTRLQREIHRAIVYESHKRLRDLGAKDEVNLNFLIEIEPKVCYPPIILAAVVGHRPSLKVILKNSSLNINAKDPSNGCNAFWYASLHGRAGSMNALAEAGIDIMCSHKYTQTNALHVAAQREHWALVKMLAESSYPLDINMKGGLTALLIAA